MTFGDWCNINVRRLEVPVDMRYTWRKIVIGQDLDRGCVIAGVIGSTVYTWSVSSSTGTVTSLGAFACLEDDGGPSSLAFMEGNGGPLLLVVATRTGVYEIRMASGAAGTAGVVVRSCPLSFLALSLTARWDTLGRARVAVLGEGGNKVEVWEDYTPHCMIQVPRGAECVKFSSDARILFVVGSHLDIWGYSIRDGSLVHSYGDRYQRWCGRITDCVAVGGTFLVSSELSSYHVSGLTVFADVLGERTGALACGLIHGLGLVAVKITGGVMVATCSGTAKAMDTVLMEAMSFMRLQWITAVSRAMVLTQRSSSTRTRRNGRFKKSRGGKTPPTAVFECTPFPRKKVN
jgi:hypothetical protein